MAVEFALLILPFIYMTFAIVELSLFFAASNMLESGVNASARLVRTGQLQNLEDQTPEEAFRADLCNRLFLIVNCDRVDLETFPLPNDDFFGADGYPVIYDEDGNVVPREFDPGDSNSVVLVRALYRYKLLTPIFAQVFSKADDNTLPLMTTIVLRTEPYDFGEFED